LAILAVQVQDGEDGAVRDRVQELVRVPARRQQPGLGLAVADDAAGEQVGVVVGGAVRVREAYPSSPPSWIEPGVSGAAWLGIRRGRRTGGRLAQPVLAGPTFG
jgi:hypothetical protein